MSDTEDHLEHEDRPGATTEEEKPINFEWTPELVKIGTSRGDIHPSIVPHKIHEKGYRDYTYRPGMTLPDPAVAGAAILIALLWFVLHRRNQRRQGNEVRYMPSLPTNHIKQYLPQSKSLHQATPSELGTQSQNQISELPSGPVTNQ